MGSSFTNLQVRSTDHARVVGAMEEAAILPAYVSKPSKTGWISVYPRTTEEVQAILAMAGETGIAIVPYGGGTSVVGGVSAIRGRFKSVVTLDMSVMDRIVCLRRVIGSSKAAD